MPEVSLEKYAQKRNFKRTTEPAGVIESSGDTPIFVIQKHQASNLHYDFRLEYDRVLKSWAVPKGPSTDPGQKRLALPTEDHPIAYADFEGVIPQEEYGGGTVMIWDIGTYRNMKEDETSMGDALDNGHLTVRLNGHKLKGGYALTRTGSGDRERWLLVKMRDDQANDQVDILEAEPNSAVSGMSLEEITASGEDADENQ